MGKFEILKNQATRQFRHNDDNSPDIFNPKDGVVIAYDKDVIDKGLEELETKLEEVTRNSNSNWNLAVKQKEVADSALDRADKAEATIKRVSKLPDEFYWNTTLAEIPHDEYIKGRRDSANELKAALGE